MTTTTEWKKLDGSVLSKGGVFDDDERRIDGNSKVTGKAKYTADFVLPGTLWAAFVASEYAHAKIISIDTQPALAIPGVHAVLTGADIPEKYFGRMLLDWPVLAIDRVCFIGQYVAAVAAESQEIADAAIAAIIVDYEEMPAVFESDAALADDALILHPDAERYVYLAGKRPPRPHPNVQGHLVIEKGDVDAGFRASDKVFEHRFTTARNHGGYLETHATLVWIDIKDVVHVISTSKVPYALRRELSACIGVPEQQIVVEQCSIGGDFGAKGLSIDDFPCYFLAKRTGRPVKAVRSYTDDIRSTSSRHAAEIVMRTGLDPANNMVAFSARVVYNGGAFAAAKPVWHLVPATSWSKTPYRVPNGRAELLTVYTNNLPASHVRAPGDLQIVFALESHIDMMASELGVDPIAFREQNAIRAGEPDIDSLEYIEPRAVEVLAQLRTHSNWGKPTLPNRGLGVALTARHIGHGRSEIKAILRADGIIEIFSPMMDQGGGTMTVLQRIAAECLTLPLDSFAITQLNTASGIAEMGPGATRGTVVTGGACLDACEKLRVALEHVGWTGRSDDLVRAAALLSEDGQGYEVVGSHEFERTGKPEAGNFSGYVIEVEVDPETGAFQICDVLYVADVGRVLNPLAHQGQINGGFVFGLGNALMEELVLEDGRITNMSLADYKIPVTKDIPPFRSVLIHAPGSPGPYGAKPIGESSTSSVAPAIANAIYRATGARITSLPITPAKVFAALHGDLIT